MQQARAVQESLAARVLVRDGSGVLERIAGVDVHYPRSKDRGLAAVAVYSYPGLELLETSRAEAAAPFPYVPGFLSFRELPAAIAALEGLSDPPDLVLCDGQGIAHPRMMGLAAHLGVVMGLPTIGAAKSRLVGEYEEVGNEKGDWTPLRYKGRSVGAVVRTRRGVKPLFVSPGHRVGLESAVGIVLGCCGRYRQPEMLRLAHGLAKKE